MTASGRLAALEARAAVEELLQDYCRAADRRDERAFRAVFHPDAEIRLGGWSGTVEDFARRGFQFLAGCTVTQHQLTAQRIRISGRSATSESYLLAYHRLAAAAPVDGPWQGHRAGEEEVLWTGGRYLDRLDDRGDGFRISRRELHMDWEQWQPADLRSFIGRDPSPVEPAATR